MNVIMHIKYKLTETVWINLFFKNVQCSYLLNVMVIMSLIFKYNCYPYL